MRPRRILGAPPGLGSAASEIAAVVVQEALPYYRREVRNLEPWLEQQGRKAGRAVNEQIRSAVFPASMRPSAPPSSTPSWVGQLIDPLLTPFARGLKAEVLPVVTSTATSLGFMVFLAGLAGGWLLGRRK